MKVSNYWGVPNQFIINTDEGEYFQSYDSIIAFIPKMNYGMADKEIIEEPKIQLDEKYWDYSQTTGKYRNKFLNETKEETQKKIDNGTYILTNLN